MKRSEKKNNGKKNYAANSVVSKEYLPNILEMILKSHLDRHIETKAQKIKCFAQCTLLVEVKGGQKTTSPTYMHVDSCTDSQLN